MKKTLNANLAKRAFSSLGEGRFPFDSTGRLVPKNLLSSAPVGDLIGFVDTTHAPSAIYLFDGVGERAQNACLMLNGIVGVTPETIVFSLTSQNALFRLEHSSQPNTLGNPTWNHYVETATRLLQSVGAISGVGAYVTQSYNERLSVDDAVERYFSDNKVNIPTDCETVPKSALGTRAYVHTLCDEVTGAPLTVAVQFTNSAVSVMAVGYGGAETTTDLNAIACIEAYEGARLLVFDDPETDEPSRNTPLSKIKNPR